MRAMLPAMPPKETFQALLDAQLPGLSYDDIAAKCGVTIRTLLDYRNLGRVRAYRTRLATVATGLGCTPDRVAKALLVTARRAKAAAAKVPVAG